MKRHLLLICFLTPLCVKSMGLKRFMNMKSEQSQHFSDIIRKNKKLSKNKSTTMHNDHSNTTKPATNERPANNSLDNGMVTTNERLLNIQEFCKSMTASGREMIFHLLVITACLSWTLFK